MHRLLWSAIFVAGVLFGTSLALVQPSHLVSAARARPAEAHVASIDLGRVSEQFESVARQCSPAVVYVEATKPSAGHGAGSKPLEESGSGVIISGAFPSTTVLTNNHVIAGALPQQITVSLADGRLYHPSRVWADPESDVA